MQDADPELKSLRHPTVVELASVFDGHHGRLDVETADQLRELCLARARRALEVEDDGEEKEMLLRFVEGVNATGESIPEGEVVREDEEPPATQTTLPPAPSPAVSAATAPPSTPTPAPKPVPRARPVRKAVEVVVEPVSTVVSSPSAYCR